VGGGQGAGPTLIDSQRDETAAFIAIIVVVMVVAPPSYILVICYNKSVRVEDMIERNVRTLNVVGIPRIFYSLRPFMKMEKVSAPDDVGQ